MSNYTDKEKSYIQELLTVLYLRLNGYLTTGFIINSEGDKIDGEVDILAIRFPKHNQDYTEHNSSDFLEVPDNIDFIIGEVKSCGQQLQFNDSIKQKASNEPIEKILYWVGLLEENQIKKVACELNSLLQPTVNTHRNQLLSTGIIKTSFGDLKIRPIIFSPERHSLNNADKFINWGEINNFIWNCLCPIQKRQQSGTRYDFTAWGYGLNEIVKIYKDRQKGNKKPETINDIYSDFENLRNKIQR